MPLGVPSVGGLRLPFRGLSRHLETVPIPVTAFEALVDYRGLFPKQFGAVRRERRNGELATWSPEILGTVPSTLARLLPGGFGWSVFVSGCAHGRARVWLV